MQQYLFKIISLWRDIPPFLTVEQPFLDNTTIKLFEQSTDDDVDLSGDVATVVDIDHLEDCPVGWSDFLGENNGTRQVVPNFYGTSIPKFHLERLLFNLNS